MIYFVHLVMVSFCAWTVNNIAHNKFNISITPSFTPNKKNIHSFKEIKYRTFQYILLLKQRVPHNVKIIYIDKALKLTYKCTECINFF